MQGCAEQSKRGRGLSVWTQINFGVSRVESRNRLLTHLNHFFGLTLSYDWPYFHHILMRYPMLREQIHDRAFSATNENQLQAFPQNEISCCSMCIGSVSVLDEDS
jgi:hypothetical protein